MKTVTFSRHYRHNTSDRVATQTVQSTVQAVLLLPSNTIHDS